MKHLWPNMFWIFWVRGNLNLKNVLWYFTELWVETEKFSLLRMEKIRLFLIENSLGKSFESFFVLFCESNAYGSFGSMHSKYLLIDIYQRKRSQSQIPIHTIAMYIENVIKKDPYTISNVLNLLLMRYIAQTLHWLYILFLLITIKKYYYIHN